MYKQLIQNLIDEDRNLRIELSKFHCSNYPDLSLAIIEKYKLKYVHDIYIKKLTVKSMSGTRKKMLRIQSIQFNKIMLFLINFIKLKQDAELPPEIICELLNDPKIVKQLCLSNTNS